MPGFDHRNRLVQLFDSYVCLKLLILKNGAGRRRGSENKNGKTHVGKEGGINRRETRKRYI